MKNSMIGREGTVLHVDAFLAAGSAVVLLAGGFAAGWILCRRDLERDYQERLDTEVAATQTHFYGQLAKEGLLNVEAEQLPASDSSADGLTTDGLDNADRDGREDLAEAVGSLEPADVHEARAAYGGDSLAELEVNQDPAPVVRNLFEDRDTSKPFDISLTEFCNIENGWMQLTLHYYIGGREEVVTDDKDEPVPAFMKLCGPLSPEMFTGELSEDPSILYRRNNQTGADYEIILKEISYHEAVFGPKNKE